MWTTPRPSGGLGVQKDCIPFQKTRNRTLGSLSTIALPEARVHILRNSTRVFVGPVSQSRLAVGERHGGAGSAGYYTY